MRRLRRSFRMAPTAPERTAQEGTDSSIRVGGEPYIPPPDYHQPMSRVTSEAPPCYATLDPLRIRPSSRLSSDKVNNGVSSTTPTSGRAEQTFRPPLLPLALSRSFYRSNSARRSSRLRRSLSSTLRRSSRRLALNISSDDGSCGRRPPLEGQLVLSGVSRQGNLVSSGSISGPVLLTQSDA